MLDTSPPGADHFDQHITPEADAGDKNDHEPGLVGVKSIKGGRAIGLVGQYREDDEGDDGKFEGGIEVLAGDVRGQAVQLWLEGQKPKGHHSQGCCQVHVIPVGQGSTDENDYGRDFAGHSHPALERVNRVGDADEQADQYQQHSKGPSPGQVG